jgi:hypothetical protein
MTGGFARLIRVLWSIGGIPVHPIHREAPIHRDNRTILRLARPLA